MANTSDSKGVKWDTTSGANVSGTVSPVYVYVKATAGGAAVTLRRTGAGGNYDFVAETALASGDRLFFPFAGKVPMTDITATTLTNVEVRIEWGG